MRLNALEREHPTTRVPFYDLAPAHAGVRRAILSDIDELIASGRFTGGPQVAEFESPTQHDVPQ